MTDILAPIQKLVEESAKKDETIRKLEAKLQKYEEILLNREKSSEDMFLIYKNDFGEDSIDIIGRNIREFGELLYHQGHKLIARQESNLEFCVYLASFDDNLNFDKSIKMIENLIEKKRKEEEENVNNKWPMNRIVPELKVNNDKLKDVKDETTKVQETLAEFKVQSEAKFNELRKNYDATSQMIQFLQKQGIEREKRRSLKVDKFYEQKKLEYIRNSPTILEKMCMRLSMKNDGDDNRLEPPFKDIVPMDEKKIQLIGYFDLLQKDLDKSTELTEIQKNIRNWIAHNEYKLLYNPTTSEIEEWKKEMEQKLGVKNIIGTVCYIHFKWYGSDYYIIFCVANSKIIRWNWNSSKQEALEKVYEYLKIYMNWATNAKFATDMEVSDDYSDYFVHVSTDEIMKITNNQKVMEWMINNFECLKYNVEDYYFLSIPSIHSLALQYFEESIE